MARYKEEQSKHIREARRIQILNAALRVLRSTG